VATSLNNLALLYYAQGKYEEALPLYKRALAIREKVLGPGHPDVALSLNNLALLYYAQGKYEEALPIYKQVASIAEKALGARHPNTKIIKENLKTCQNALRKK
jgi:tetratricopeptide (TPR) repeat protein